MLINDAETYIRDYLIKEYNVYVDDHSVLKSISQQINFDDIHVALVGLENDINIDALVFEKLAEKMEEHNVIEYYGLLDDTRDYSSVEL
jgi:hypothetical protein